MSELQPKGAIALEDGRVFGGVSFGAQGLDTGEVVFNTGMTGYQEIVTDPSYRAQIVTMTYPLIGNYGVNAGDEESGGPQVKGLITREYCPYPSGNVSEKGLAEYLSENGIIALSGIDTRALTRHIRQAGAMRAAIAAGDFNDAALVEMAARSPSLSERDLVREVSCRKVYDYECDWNAADKREKVILYDYGAKLSILKCLSDAGFCVRVVPAETSAEKVKEMHPGGVVLSNGPGDPCMANFAVAEVRKLISDTPLLGICLGHQIAALALGGKTYKLKFGHRGSNHPVKDLRTGKIYITCQNHGFCVDADSLPAGDVEVTHRNLNDQTLEGFIHRRLPLLCVQHHPESAPGPSDAMDVFSEFKTLVLNYV